MRLRLYLVLILFVCIGSLVLFAILHKTDQHLSSQLTRIAPQDQAELQGYAEAAARFHRNQDIQGMQALVEKIEQRHNTWVAILTQDLRSSLGTQVPPQYLSRLSFQRQLHWPVHSMWDEVLIGIPFPDQNASLVIRLPESMRPKPNLMLLHVGLTWLLPLIILLIFTHRFYFYLLKPINILKNAAMDLTNKESADPVRPQLGRRQDELAQLATTFDQMSSRIQSLVRSQRQLIGDLSHELRTPLARMRLVLGSDWPRDDCDSKMIEEISRLNHLIDDAMTVAWLDSDQRHRLPPEQQEQVQLSQLLNVICDDAEFEFASRHIIRNYPNDLILEKSNGLALSQILENIIRNGLIHSPANTDLLVSGEWVFIHESKGLRVCIQDQGLGVPSEQLEKIFEPFYRLDKARMRKNGGFGLGLAIAQKQTERLGGKLSARNSPAGGLMMVVELPVD